MNNEVKSLNDVLEILLERISNKSRLEHIRAIYKITDTKKALIELYQNSGASWCGKYGYECRPKNVSIHYGSKKVTYTWEVIAKMVDKRNNGDDAEIYEQLTLLRI